jgi:hypothetical protein
MNMRIGKLRGRVIINALGEFEYPVLWDAEVRVGNPSKTVYPLLDLYSPTTDQLGGGSAGILPFAVHKSDCNPVHSSTVAPTDFVTGNQPFLRWYGPVSLVGTASPLNITQRKINAASGDPVHDLAECFTFKPVEGETRIPFSPTGTFIPVGDYVVRGAAGIVKNNVLGAEVGDVRAGTDGELRFSVRWPCPGDFNNDNTVNTADLVTFLGQFGQSGTCGNNRDLDGDLAVNTADLVIFLGQFGNTCSSARPGAPAVANEPTTKSAPAVTRAIAAAESSATNQGATTEAGRPGTPAPLPPVLEALGFTSIEQYTAYVDNLSEEQLNAHIVQLLQTIEALNLP